MVPRERRSEEIPGAFGVLEAVEVVLDECEAGAVEPRVEFQRHLECLAAGILFPFRFVPDFFLVALRQQEAEVCILLGAGDGVSDRFSIGVIAAVVGVDPRGDPPEQAIRLDRWFRATQAIESPEIGTRFATRFVIFGCAGRIARLGGDLDAAERGSRIVGETDPERPTAFRLAREDHQSLRAGAEAQGDRILVEADRSLDIAGRHFDVIDPDPISP